jgi:hypothetical protein
VELRDRWTKSLITISRSREAAELCAIASASKLSSSIVAVGSVPGGSRNSRKVDNEASLSVTAFHDERNRLVDPADDQPGMDPGLEIEQIAAGNDVVRQAAI